MKGYGWEKPLGSQNPGLHARLGLTWDGSAGEERPRCRQLPDTASPPSGGISGLEGSEGFLRRTVGQQANPSITPQGEPTQRRCSEPAVGTRR